MELLFIYIFLALAGISWIFYLVYKPSSDEGEKNFTSDGISLSEEPITQAQREEDAYEDRQTGVIALISKKAPGLILTFILVNIATSLLTGYISVKNAERLAMAGSAISQGDYGSAMTSLFTMAKPELLEQGRIASGSHPECKQPGFSYIGKLDGKNVCMLDHLFSFQDHDPNIGKDSEYYGRLLLDQSVDNAQEICQEKYGGNLISIEEWELNRGHFLSAMNIKEFPNTPEWTRNVSSGDSDDYLVIQKDSGVREYVIKEGIDMEEKGKYVDSDDISTVAFRCSITW